MPEAPDIDEEDFTQADRIASNADAIREAWEATLEDMEAMAAARREDGWEAVSCMAVDTAPTNPDAGDRDDFGLVFVLPNNMAEDFEDAYEGKAFPKYEVYRASDEGRAYVVVEYIDPETETAIFVAGQYELRFAPGMVKAARREDEMYTYAQLIDGTRVGAFEHDSVDKFVPEIDRIEDYRMESMDPQEVAKKLDDVEAEDVEDGAVEDA
ncbi:hypothetical protein [Halorubellus sp. PRR65]|uniref:DUF7529 family protein n=1 Tax=Halorubellus sp. PRR65 TaxID=3098148 RepID=UPI002B257A38|nr:hypothetical protein [Halorubellus sp. PRR65]